MVGDDVDGSGEGSVFLDGTEGVEELVGVAVAVGGGGIVGGGCGGIGGCVDDWGGNFFFFFSFCYSL